MLKKPLTYIIALASAAILFVPLITTTIPEWRVLVVDRFDNPQPNAKVRQIWSFHQEPNEETLSANEHGVVVFAERQRTESLFAFSIYFLVHKVNSIVTLHGTSKEPNALVYSAEGEMTNRLYYIEGRTMENKLILRSRP